MDNKITDPIIQSVVSKIIGRSEVGVRKYNTTLDKNELTTLQWLIHAQEEAMDFVNYLEKLISIERKNNATNGESSSGNEKS